MHRPTERHDALRQRVFAGRERQSAKQRRAAVARKGGRRAIAIGAGLAMVAGVLTVTQLASSALEDNEAGLGASDECTTVVVEEVEANEDLELHIEEDSDGVTHRHYRKKKRGAPEPEPEPITSQSDNCDEEGSGSGDSESAGGEGSGGEGSGEGSGDPDGSGEGSGDPDGSTDGDGDGTGVGGTEISDNGLEILGQSCDNSDLPLHTGFQSEEAQCIGVEFGEVSAVENNPTLLITDFPEWVGVDEDFSITFSTRNLVRDRFLGAADGGYMHESSYLDENGITRGHAHIACLNLIDGNVAPEVSTTLEPQLFAAIEDEGGGAGASSVTVDVPALSEPGLYRCMVWAGDGTHAVPRMSFARQQIAVDAVRITVTDGTEENSDNE